MIFPTMSHILFENRDPEHGTPRCRRLCRIAHGRPVCVPARYYVGFFLDRILSMTYVTATILQAVASGYRYGFDIIDATGLPGGTVYPALRRLEDAGHLTASWEKEAVARAEPRPPRRYYEMTR